MLPAPVRLISVAVLVLSAPFLVAAGVDQYGDPLPSHAVARLGTLRFRGINGVRQAAAMPGGKQILGLGFDATVILWDAATGKEIRRFTGPKSLTFGSLAVSPDGKILAVGTVDASQMECRLLLFDLATGRQRGEWLGHRWHGHSGYPLLAFVTPAILVSAGDYAWPLVWDAARQRELHQLRLPRGSCVSAIVPSPDGKHVFIAGWDDRKSFWTAWQAATGKLVHQEMGLPGSFPELAVSPDGRSLALAMGMGAGNKPGYTEMRIYSVSGWKEGRRWQAHRGEDTGRCSIAFSPDGKMIATGGADGKVRRWDAATGKEIAPVIDPVQQYSQSVFYLDDTTLATFGFQSTVKLWDAEGKQKCVFAGSEEQVTALAYAPDGRHVAVGGGDSPIRIWDVAGGKQVAQLRDGHSYVTCLHFSSDGKWLLSGDNEGRARLWSWPGVGAPVRSIEHKSSELSAAFSPDGKSLATGGDDGVVCVWTIATGERIHRLKGPDPAKPGPRVRALAFSPDGQALLSISLQGIRHWSLATGKEVRLLRPKSLGHTNAVSALVLSPGGRWAYSSSYDGSICVWEVGRGRLARIIDAKKPGYNGPVRITLSSDGTRLAAGFLNDWDNPCVHLWDLLTGQNVALMGHRAPPTGLAFSPHGCRLASGSCDTTALVWDITHLGAGSKSADGKALAGLWKDLGADDPKAAHAAVCAGAASGDAAVAQLKRDLEPARKIAPDRIAVLIQQLDADEFAQRRQASRALIEAGPDAEPMLQEALRKAESLELRRRLERILNGQEMERRQGNAVEVLEMIGTPAARRLLADLAKGASDARLTRTARLALDRLEKRP